MAAGRMLVPLTAAAGALLLAGCVSWGGPGPKPPAASAADLPVTAPEDLMREHGLLRRVLLVYEEAARRLDGGEALPAKPVREAAGIIRSFIEDYHEKLEEEFIFPRFEAAGRQLELVKALRAQHQAGRRITAEVLELAGAGEAVRPEDRARLAAELRQFIRMYRPHAAREDTVLFPELRGVVSARNFRAMCEAFEDREEDLFGEGGFEKMVARVAAIETALGIGSLDQFTPAAELSAGAGLSRAASVLPEQSSR